jgi:hypothetical protein
MSDAARFYLKNPPFSRLELSSIYGNVEIHRADGIVKQAIGNPELKCLKII